MVKEEAHQIMTELELRREISKLKHEIRLKDKIIKRLQEKIKRRG